MSSGRGYGRTVYIENEAAYAEARERNIKANARKGRGRRWLAEDATRQELVNWLADNGGPGARNCSGFLAKMWESLEEWGSLTDGQERAVRKIMADRVAKQAEFKARDAASQHVGTIGERREFTLRVSFVTSFESAYGTTYVTGLRDAADNVFICKGVALGHDDGARYTSARKGDTVTLKATIKAHGERDGVKQTVLQRPKLSVIVPAPDKTAPAPAPAPERKIEGFHVVALRLNGTTDYFPELFATREAGEAMQARLAAGEFGNWSEGAPLDTVAQWSAP